MKKCRVPLDDEELDTILVIARNSQSGRITEYEIKELVRGYRQVQRMAAEARAIGDAIGERGLVDLADDVRMLAKL